MIEVLEINSVGESAVSRRIGGDYCCRLAERRSFSHGSGSTATGLISAPARNCVSLLVLSDKEPVGILPLIVAPENTRLGRFRLLTYPLRDWATFYGPIGPRPATTLLAGLSYILGTRRRWDVIDLRSTNEDTDRGRTPWVMRKLGHPHPPSVWKISDVVELRNGWDAYLASRSSRFRNNLRCSEQRAHQLGRLEYQRFRPLGGPRRHRPTVDRL